MTLATITYGTYATRPVLDAIDAAHEAGVPGWLIDRAIDELRERTLAEIDGHVNTSRWGFRARPMAVGPRGEGLGTRDE